MNDSDDSDEVCILILHSGSVKDGAELVFNFNNHRVAVSVFPSSSTRTADGLSIQDHVIDLLSIPPPDELDIDELERHEREALEIILAAGRPIFRAQAPLCTEPDLPRDLHSKMYPTTYHFKLLDEDGKAAIVPINANEAKTVPADVIHYDSGEEDELGVDSALPCYSSRAIKFWLTEKRCFAKLLEIQKWVEQIRDAVHALHASGAVWRDVKASNAVIDEQDDAWLINFGGGWTEGWVDKDIAGTVEGDEMAIGTIEKVLKGDLAYVLED